MKKILIYLFTVLIFVSCEEESATAPIKETPKDETPKAKTETFTLKRNDFARKGKIYLPASYETNKNLPVIYLIDFAEQHFETATDEFATVIDGVKQIEGFDALVVTLENIPDIQVNPTGFDQFYNLFKNITSYVDSNYTNNTSRTFIGRGSEAGVVLQTVFLEKTETSLFENFIATGLPLRFITSVMEEVKADKFPKNKLNKKLHYSSDSGSESFGQSNTNLIDMINSAQYPWLQFESVKYKDLDFANTYYTAYVEGLKYVFNK